MNEMITLDTMELKPGDVENCRQALKIISERIHLYALGHEALEVNWADIRKIAKAVLLMDHKSKAIYARRQTTTVTGTMGVKLQRAVNNPPVDSFTYKCWIIQAGPETVQDYYLYPCFRGELDAETIDDIGAIIEKGAEAIEAMGNWTTGSKTFYKSRLWSETDSPAPAPSFKRLCFKDPMFVINPIEEGFEFRVRVSAFYHPAPEDISGGGIKDLHFMDRDIVESRLRLLQFIATQQGSWIHEDIAHATALVLPKMSNDNSIPSFK
ncbi:hypothetical protein B0T11DRAFT_348896 [Plectosphaerella cucumerina]|jgi:hypothetical protein|uniref:Uncharacterized protein n=1 Tax=Plectosphaerella cucumerina TaxID=40658 RepID=A0A8K0TQE5_9PEZI|nr:hypothetical protein B0T11DRAFT_348896 [Plectosphaerella cucumerina]